MATKRPSVARYAYKKLPIVETTESGQPLKLAKVDTVSFKGYVRPPGDFGEVGIATVQPGEEVSTHSHTSDIVHIVAAGSLMYSFKKGDTVEEVEFAAPGAMLVEANAMYAVRNIGPMPAIVFFEHGPNVYWFTK